MIDKYRVILSYQAQQNLQQAPQQEPIAPRNQGEAAKVLAQYGRKPDSPDIKQMMKILEEQALAGGRFGKTASITKKTIQEVSTKTGWPVALLMAIAMLMPQATQANQSATRASPEVRSEQGISANFKLPQAIVDRVVMLPQWVVNAAGMDGFSTAVEASMMESLKDEALLLALGKSPNAADSLVDASWRKLQEPTLAPMVNKFMRANKADEGVIKDVIKGAVAKKLPQIQQAINSAKKKSIDRIPLAAGPQAPLQGVQAV